MTERLKILLYGDVDLNLIDGSAMWLVSLTQVLHEDRNIDIDILQKRPIINNKLVKPLLKRKGLILLILSHVLKGVKDGIKENVYLLMMLFKN